jgi:O-antigen ligase
VASLCINQNRYFEIFILSLAFAGAFNVFYGFLQVNGIDPIDWNNNFNAIIGTLGNPNFSSAFIAISLLTYPSIFFGIQGKLTKAIIVALFFISLYAIFLTKSQQGFIFLVTGAAIIANLYIFKKLRNKVFGYIFLFGSSLGFLVSIAGILQKGRFSSLLYQPSVSLRGFYWNAGLNMFQNSPLVGNGLDVYGDLYARYRDPNSILPPGGPAVVTNTAHNVFIDLAASGGIILLLPYLSIVGYVIYLATKVIKKTDFDWVFVTLLSTWVAFQFELLISINQIGLAVWVWALNGLMIARSKWLLSGGKANEEAIQKVISKNKSPVGADVFLVSMGTTLVFAFASLPEQVADMNFKSSMQSQNVEKVLKSVDSFPKSSERMSRSAQVLLRNGLNDNALTISRRAVNFNPDHINSWITLAFNPAAPIDERIQAKRNLIRLDPLNNEWKTLEIK